MGDGLPAPMHELLLHNIGSYTSATTSQIKCEGQPDNFRLSYYSIAGFNPRPYYWLVDCFRPLV